MPSIATSLAGATGDTLQQVLQARELQKLQQMAQMEQQRKALMEQARLDIAMQGNQRAGQATELAGKRFEFDKSRATAADAAKADEAAAKQRQATNARGVIDMMRQAGDKMSPLDRRLMALEAGANPTATSFDTPKPFSETLGEQTQLAEMRAKTTAKYRKPTGGAKATKDSPKAPKQFLDTIQNRIGSTGFENVDAAIKSIEARWPEWRKNYPGLDVNAVRTALQNIYGKKPTSGAGDALLERIMQGIGGQVKFDDEP